MKLSDVLELQDKMEQTISLKYICRELKQPCNRATILLTGLSHQENTA